MTDRRGRACGPLPAHADARSLMPPTFPFSAHQEPRSMSRLIRLAQLAAVVIAVALATPAPASEDNKPPAGFTALFNGKDLDRLEGPHHDDRAGQAKPEDAREAPERSARRPRWNTGR